MFLAEKCWRHGVGLTRIVGVTLLALGLLVVVEPALLPVLSGAVPADTMPQPGM